MTYSPPERGSFIRRVQELRAAVRASGGKAPPVPYEPPAPALAPRLPSHLHRCDVHEVGWAGDEGCWANGLGGTYC